MASRDPTCTFCQIASGTTPAHVVWRDDVAIAFLDRSPVFRGHTLVVPTDHVVQLSDLPGSGVGPFFLRVQLLARAVPVAFDAPGTFVAMNNIVSQSVAHLHAHVVPRRKGDGLRGFFWPREKYREGESEEFAGRLRDAISSLDVDDGLSGR